MLKKKIVQLIENTCFFTILLAPASLEAYEVDFSYERFFRLNTPINKSEADQWMGLSARTEEPVKGDWDYFFEGDTRLYLGGGTDFNYSIPELYVQVDRESEYFAVGRRLLDWNQHEHYWQLGYLNGQQGFALLSEKQEGLVGVHYEHRSDWLDVKIFFSYLYVPSLNPGYDVDNGKITSTSEWVRMPPSRTVYNGESADINYKINYPDIPDVVFKKSLGGAIDLKWTDGLFRVYAIYKPENKIRANASAFYDTDTDRVEVTADPVVNHHALYGAQIHQTLSNHFFFLIGIDVNDPNVKLGEDFNALDPIQMREQNRTFESDFFTILPSYDRESYAHASVSYTNRLLDLGAHYIHLLSSNTRGSDDFFSDTVKWKSTIGLFGRYRVTDIWDLVIDWKYDFHRKDNILHGETNYFFWENLHLAFGFELIKAPKKTSYWSAYRANDVVFTSFVYTF